MVCTTLTRIQLETNLPPVVKDDDKGRLVVISTTLAKGQGNHALVLRMWKVYLLKYTSNNSYYTYTRYCTIILLARMKKKTYPIC